MNCNVSILTFYLYKLFEGSFICTQKQNELSIKLPVIYIQAICAKLIPVAIGQKLMQNPLIIEAEPTLKVLTKF